MRSIPLFTAVAIWPAGQAEHPRIFRSSRAFNPRQIELARPLEDAGSMVEIQLELDGAPFQLRAEVDATGQILEFRGVAAETSERLISYFDSRNN